MKKSSIYILTLIFLLIPLTTQAQLIDLNLDYPSIGSYDLDTDQEIGQIITFFAYFIIAISGVAAFTMLVWGGIEWMTSAGNTGRIGNAKDRILKAFLGLLLILTSVVILEVINPSFTSFSFTPTLQSVSGTGTPPLPSFLQCQGCPDTPCDAGCPGGS